jgi:DNA repair exonuclease SbcCD ATPase subunit/DNA repair exonuclease SbcCD nuclease subunit
VSIKIAHIADTHIRNFNYHKEYRQIFNNLYETLKQEKVDYIVHCGDIAHTKTQLSPEFFDLAGDFLCNLADIAPTYVILGNHDGNLKNSNRQDAITPIAQTLNHPELKILKNSGEYKVNDKLVFNVLSIFDEDNWVKPTNPNLINVALYHGAIAGSQTDLGWTMKEGDHDVDIFGNHDYAFLGDIHKTNQILDSEGRVRYPGSTVQQNFGETNDKGFLIWEIEDKDNFNCRLVSLPNPKPFITIELEQGELPANLQVPENSRVRIVSDITIQKDKIVKLLDIVNKEFKPESVVFSGKTKAEMSADVENHNKIDLRDNAVQENLIREFLINQSLEEETLQKIFDLNRELGTIVQETEDISRGINWKIKHFEWSNLFNYGEDNVIDFTNLSGLVGIFGKNYSGKSSIVDSMIYTIFGSSSKNEKKIFDIINQRKSDAYGKVEIEVGDSTYTIHRKLSKIGKKKNEAKSELDFYITSIDGEVESLNGISRVDTDNNIRKIFGSIDDFMSTSMSSQLDSLSFIREGSTKRKEILAKFLDLEMFDKKNKLAKEASTDLRGAIKKLDIKDFDLEQSTAQNELENCNNQTNKAKEKVNILTEEINLLSQEIEELTFVINKRPTDLINGNELNIQLNRLKTSLDSSTEQMLENDETLTKTKQQLTKIESFLSSIDIGDLKIKQSKADELSRKIELLNRDLVFIDKKSSLLNEVPCGSQYKTCKFIRDAYDSLEARKDVEEQINSLKEQFGSMDKETIDSTIKKYNDITTKKFETIQKIDQTSIWQEKLIREVERKDKELETIQKQLENYEENKEIISKIQEAIAIRGIKQDKKRTKEFELSSINNDIINIAKKTGSAEQRIQTINEQKQELINLKKDYLAYEMFMKCMHSSGIAYEVIKKTLPYLNAEIAKILTNITDFEIFFEEESDKLEIYIKHPDQDSRPIGMASGAEKSMAGMAIRLGLLQVSNLPKADIMVLDEPATALDEEHIQSFTNMLDMIKSQFKTTLLISHLDSLKDIADKTIEITKEDNFACVRE